MSISNENCIDVVCYSNATLLHKYFACCISITIFIFNQTDGPHSKKSSNRTKRNHGNNALSKIKKFNLLPNIRQEMLQCKKQFSMQLCIIEELPKQQNQPLVSWYLPDYYLKMKHNNNKDDATMPPPADSITITTDEMHSTADKSDAPSSSTQTARKEADQKEQSTNKMMILQCKFCQPTIMLPSKQTNLGL